jgi:hypothetical protein
MNTAETSAYHQKHGYLTGNLRRDYVMGSRKEHVLEKYKIYIHENEKHELNY